MSVPISNVTRRQVYAPSGAGGAGPYAFTFEILANTDIAVYKDDVLLTLTTHYTVTINANGTGSVTITAAGLALAPTSPTQYAIVGNRTISRTTDFTTGGDFFANTLNDELDQQTIFAQQNAEGLQRALSAPQTDPTSINMTLPRASLRANKALGFDANGNPAISDTLGTNRGNWSAGVLYYARDIVKDTTNNNIWQCLVQHTSSGSQPINTNADSAKWSLLVDAASATASASAAASSASAASTSASNASTSASNASTSASNASTSASNAASSASSASTSASNAAASYDSFDDRYLGSKSSAPSVDNDGNSLLTGALYWDTVVNQMRVWSGTAWVNVNASASNTRTAITATAGQTVLTVATYTPGTNTMVVYVNGVKLNASEYTETNSTTITVTTGLALNDEVEVFSYRVNEIGTIGASSVTIADTGNYYAGSNVETALQEAAQASTTKFTSAGTGAVTRTAQSKMRDVVSVKDFGAVGNGTADDTSAFAAAIAAASSLGCAVYIPGTANYYKLLDELTVPDGVTIYGDGWFSRIKQETTVKNSFIAGNNCTFDKLRISGDGVARNASSFTKENGIYAAGKRNVSVRHCFIDGWQACGVQMANCFNYDISHNLFFNNYWSYPSGTTSASDICVYSSAAGARAVIIGNLCLSDNSQGIFYNAQGYDTDATIVGNVCVTLDASWNEKASGSLNRRHGIVVTYGGSSSAGRIAVTGNVCRNTLVTGIYSAMASGGQMAVTIMGNTCSLNGFATVSDASLAGGISINGGQAGLIIANNAIHDFRGSTGADVGGITYNDQDADANASAVIVSNTINSSTARGIVLKGTPKNVDVRGNLIRDAAQEDINLITTDATKLKNIRINGNQCQRTNATSPSIKIDTVTSTQRFWIEDNILIGFNSGTVSFNNSGIYLRRADVMSATVKNNKIRNFYSGIFGEQPISGRTIGRLRIDYNEIETATEGISLRGTAASALVPCLGNRFTSVTAKFEGAGYDIAGLEVSAILDETRLHFESAASPTSRTFAVGDYAKNRAPAAGQPKGWYCTVAGTPGTWVSEGNL